MENRKGSPLCVRRPATHQIFIFYFLISIFLVVAGCGSPGEPTPPLPPVPEVINDLTAKQAGDSVLLTFTMPGKSTLGERLPQTPAFEVLRGSLRADGKPDPKSFRVVDTVPGALVSRYVQRGQVQFTDPVSPADAQARSGQPILYRVRTLISDKHPSPDSQAVSVSLYPVPEPLASLDLSVTEQGIQLKWPAPTRTSSGQALAAVKEYHVYRGELNPSAANQPATNRQPSDWKSPLLSIGTTTTPDYRDSGFDYGKTYVYVVRSVVDSPGGLLESGDSPQEAVTPKDVFPPASPQGLVAAIQRGATPDSVLVELSWSINVEPDLAGYRVYRSAQEGSQGDLLTPTLLPSPAYRDITVQSGQHYSYTVTAVDQSGNESAPSLAVAVDVAQPLR